MEDSTHQLYFDDDDLTHQNRSASKTPKGTPTNPIRLWNLEAERPEECIRAVVALLASRPSLGQWLRNQLILRCRINNLLAVTADTQPEAKLLRAKLHLALAALPLDKGDPDETTDLIRKATTLYLDSNLIGRQQLAETLDRHREKVMELAGRKYDREIQRIFKRHALLRDMESSSTFNLRQTALDLLFEGDYAMAEKIYLRLLKLNFAPMSTHCHLARLHIITGEFEKAENDVESAWACKDEGEPYMVARTIYLQILLAMLSGNEFSKELESIKQLLSEGRARMHWTTEPMLEALEKRLSADHLDFMRTLVKDLSS